MLTFKRLNIHNSIGYLILGSFCAFFLLFLAAFFYPFAGHARAAEVVILEGEKIKGKKNLDNIILLNTSDYEGSTEGDTPSQPAADPADQEAADEVINQINLLNGESTADDILAVITAYDTLTPTQQAIVQETPDTFGKLTELVGAAKSVINQIEILSDDSSAEDIAAARAAYDNLTPIQQEIVQKTPGTLDKLESQEARIKDEDAKKAAAEEAAAEKEAAEKAAAEKAAAEKAAAEKAAAEKEAKDQAAADAVTIQINALTNKSSEKKVKAARKAYNGLTKAQKAKVSSKTLKKLTKQEARIKSEKAKKSSSSKSSSSSSSSSSKSSSSSSSSSSTSSSSSSSSSSTSSTSSTTASTSTVATTSASTQDTATDTTPATDPSASTTDPSDYSTYDTTGTTGTDTAATSSDDVFMKLIDGAADGEEEDDEDMEDFLDEVKPNILVLPGLAAIILCGGLAGILWYRKRMDEALGINRYQNLVEKLTAATHRSGIKGFFAKIGLVAVKAAGKIGSVLNAILGIVAAFVGKVASVLDAGFGIIAAATGKVKSVAAAGFERVAGPLKKLAAPVKIIVAPLGKVTSAVGNAVSKLTPIGRRANPGSV